MFALDTKKPGLVKGFEAQIQVYGELRRKGGLRPETKEQRETMKTEIDKLNNSPLYLPI